MIRDYTAAADGKDISFFEAIITAEVFIDGTQFHFYIRQYQIGTDNSGISENDYFCEIASATTKNYTVTQKRDFPFVADAFLTSEGVERRNVVHILRILNRIGIK